MAKPVHERLLRLQRYAGRVGAITRPWRSLQHHGGAFAGADRTVAPASHALRGEHRALAGLQSHPLRPAIRLRLFRSEPSGCQQRRLPVAVLRLSGVGASSRGECRDLLRQRAGARRLRAALDRQGRTGLVRRGTGPVQRAHAQECAAAPRAGRCPHQHLAQPERDACCADNFALAGAEFWDDTVYC